MNYSAEPPSSTEVLRAETGREVRTIEEFRWAANYVIEHAEDDGYIVTSKQKLHHRTYAEVREQTDLQANLVQSARSRAVDGPHVNWP